MVHAIALSVLFATTAPPPEPAPIFEAAVAGVQACLDDYNARPDSADGDLLRLAVYGLCWQGREAGLVASEAVKVLRQAECRQSEKLALTVLLVSKGQLQHVVTAIEKLQASSPALPHFQKSLQLAQERVAEFLDDSRVIY